jgi:hypothetical protein
MAQYCRAAGLCALVAVLACGGCGTTADIDPQADQALRSMSKALGSAEALSFQAEGVMDETLETGQLSQFSRRSRILISRPNKLHAVTEGDDVSREVWYDGKTVTVLDVSAKTYAVIQAPRSIGKTVDHMIDTYGLTMPLADLLFVDTYGSLTANVVTGVYLGKHSVGETPCHHLAFRQETIDWQIWIEAGKTPVPRKLVITYKLEPGHPQFVGTMDEWDLSPKPSGNEFEFRPPVGAKTVEMDELLGIEEGE